MEDNRLQLEDSVLYRKVYDELVLVHVNSGIFYHFSVESEQFFNFFREPRKLSEYLEFAQPENEEGLDRGYLKEFCQFLLDKKVLLSSSNKPKNSAQIFRYQKPSFLKQGDQTLEELSFVTV